ncbi:MAG TPA: homogentisate 1,2-dioxygenase domain-containing protein, partial [Sphingomicrobium sp.]
EGFQPGGLSLHNLMSGHGPDLESWRKASGAELKPVKIEGTMAFMIESRWVFHCTDHALETSALDEDYDQVWSGFPKAELP